MESSIAVFLTWQSACELLPTEHHGASQLIVAIQNIDGGIQTARFLLIMSRHCNFAMYFIPSRPFGYDQV